MAERSSDRTGRGSNPQEVLVGIGEGTVRILDEHALTALLARTVGSSRETVTLVLGELSREGFVARSGRSYLLRIDARDLEQPQHLADSSGESRTTRH